jgi:hypothetical protein
MNRTLHLTLKRRWFEDILAGRKTEEYREDKPYWHQRILAWAALGKGLQIDFRNGYRYDSPRMVVECPHVASKPLVIEGLSGGKARRYFVLSIGKILLTRNLEKLRPAKCRLHNKLCRRFPCQHAGSRTCQRRRS